MNAFPYRPVNRQKVIANYKHSIYLDPIQIKMKVKIAAINLSDYLSNLLSRQLM